MKCPVCNNEINGFVCSECGFDESMNYEKFPTLAVCNNIVSISSRMKNFHYLWETEDINEYYKLELLVTDALRDVGKAQKNLAEFYYSKNEHERFEYWKAQAEGNGFNVDCSKISVISNNVFDFSKVNKMKTKEKVCAGNYNTVRIFSDGACASTKIKLDSFSYGHEQISSWTNIVDVAIGSFHSVGLKSDGTVEVATKAQDDYRELRKAKQWTDIVDIAVGNNFTVGVKKDGTVVFCGALIKNSYVLAEWNDIVSVSASSDHIMGLKKDGTVVACGNNRSRKCEVSEWEDIIAVSAGYHNSIGLKSDGTVVSTSSFWSYDSSDVKSWKKIVSISVGTCHLVGLKSDGTVVACGSNGYHRGDISDWTDIVAISAGEYHTVGLKSNGEIVAVGDNSSGQCNVKELMR